ncbi:MAG: hypothetical protein KZQ89_17765 [Candidatus Thiodiazotropha sp. (ex Lucinoma kastoroae)]|nr:hypothetical protein [Candidatus Thiodiazotropha sp. (ex Troendleina suluensis)]MCU7849801.1 hypothetical protein [Candidatus Thiodiazotropha sp. (ex Lucinoma kastoroae)]MCU7861522.1 hypothetical protein [Candidatus Thiodiazotropha sp. (ex Lucinoma kastoroae)]
MHDGEIQIEGFEDDNCMCREVAIHAMLCAIGELQREIAEDIARPGGSGNVSMDFSSDLRQALGMPEPWIED